MKEKDDENRRWNERGRPTGPGAATERHKAAEARIREEDAWLDEQMNLTRKGARQ